MLAVTLYTSYFASITWTRRLFTEEILKRFKDFFHGLVASGTRT